MTSAYDTFVEAAARALSRPVAGCVHTPSASVVYACLCCPGTIRCHPCHLDHLPDHCPVCVQPLLRDLPVTHQIEHDFNTATSAIDAPTLTVHGEICTSCAIDNDWPNIDTSG